MKPENTKAATKSGRDTVEFFDAETGEVVDSLALADADSFKSLKLRSLESHHDVTTHVGRYRNLDTNRPPQINARNDWEAIRSFLSDRAESGSPHTVRSYEKECLRLLLFCRFFALKPLSDLDRDDARAYKGFLESPPDYFVHQGQKKRPVTMWLVSKDSNGQKVTTFNEHWRPFRKKKGLSEGSVNLALATAKSLATYLVNADYLTSSPFRLGRLSKKRTGASESAEFVLGEHAKAAIDSVIDDLPGDTERDNQKRVRLRWIVDLMYGSGLRISEVANGSMGDIVNEREQWWVRTIGKGKKLRKVPFPATSLCSLARYRDSLKFDSDVPMPGESAPLVASFKGTTRIGASHLRDLLKGVFHAAAERLDDSDGKRVDYKLAGDIRALRSATPHWLRHTYTTDLLDAGVSPQQVRDNLGHSSLDTTMIYHHGEATARHAATERALKGARTTTEEDSTPPT